MRTLILLASLALLAGCADQLSMTRGQLDHALLRMTVADCDSRASAAVPRQGLERATYVHACVAGAERR